jgi:hypothetical protein
VQFSYFARQFKHLTRAQSFCWMENVLNYRYVTLNKEVGRKKMLFDDKYLNEEKTIIHKLAAIKVALKVVH